MWVCLKCGAEVNLIREVVASRTFKLSKSENQKGKVMSESDIDTWTEYYKCSGCGIEYFPYSSAEEKSKESYMRWNKSLDQQ